MVDIGNQYSELNVDAERLLNMASANQICGHYKALLRHRESNTYWDKIFGDVVAQLDTTMGQEDDTAYNSAVRKLVILLEDYEDDERLVAVEKRVRTLV